MPNEINRRDMLKTSLAGAGLCAVGVGSVHAAGSRKGPPKFDNASFYDKDGKFIVEKGQDAYIEVMKYHGFPVFPNIREKLWVSDYGIGEFTGLGLGANMYINNHAEHEGDRYMLMDLFLLPGQMLPEHYHLEGEEARPKLESWLVRHGMSYIIGAGEATPGIKDMMPESQRASATVFHAIPTGPGGYQTQPIPEGRHSQIAGPEGTIMTEVANYHDDAATFHSNTKLVFP